LQDGIEKFPEHQLLIDSLDNRQRVIYKIALSFPAKGGKQWLVKLKLISP